MSKQTVPRFSVGQKIGYTEPNLLIVGYHFWDGQLCYAVLNLRTGGVSELWAQSTPDNMRAFDD